MYEWVANDDLGIKAVVTRLQERGIPPPCPAFHARKRDGWRSVTVYNVLTHPRYLGTNFYGKAPGTHEVSSPR